MARLVGPYGAAVPISSHFGEKVRRRRERYRAGREDTSGARPMAPPHDCPGPTEVSASLPRFLASSLPSFRGPGRFSGQLKGVRP